MLLPKPEVLVSEDNSIISIRFPLGIDSDFLESVKKQYKMNGQYSSMGMDKPIKDGEGYLVIFYRKR